MVHSIYHRMQITKHIRLDIHIGFPICCCSTKGILVITRYGLRLVPNGGCGALAIWRKHNKVSTCFLGHKINNHSFVIYFCHKTTVSIICVLKRDGGEGEKKCRISDWIFTNRSYIFPRLGIYMPIFLFLICGYTSLSYCDGTGCCELELAVPFNALPGNRIIRLLPKR